jgi:hypothetical protein
VFSLLNNSTPAGNYKSQVSNFLSFSTTSDTLRPHGSRAAFYVIDPKTVTGAAKLAIGLRIAHLLSRPVSVRRHNRKD